MTSEQKQVSSSPLSVPLFRAFWIAMVFSNIGTYAHDVATGWLMTELTDSAFLVTMIQVAATLPVFLLGVPAGALADILNRRVLILRTQVFMLIVCLGLAALSYGGLLSPGLLLLFTALLGVATALAAPGLQATIPDLVPPAALPSALALGSSAINIARAVGPALAAFTLGYARPGAVFLFNAISFIGLILVMTRWKSPAPRAVLPPESLIGAMRIGFRYVKFCARFRNVLWRVALFVLPASGLWALLPLHSRSHISQSPAVYGFLMTMLGAGAVAAAWLLPLLRGKLRQQQISLLGSIGFGAAAVGFGLVSDPARAFLLLSAAGACWLMMIATLNLAAQTELPSWVRARGLGINLIVFSGSMALGGLVWGSIAEWAGSPFALQLAGLTTILAAFTGLMMPLRQPSPGDLAAAHPWPDPPAGRHVSLEEGPVLVTVEYHVDEADRRAFLALVYLLRIARLRDGAYRWSIHESVEKAGVYCESFELESWVDHLRQHDRVSKADAILEQRVDALHRGEGPPVVRHYIARIPGMGGTNDSNLSE